MLCNSSNVMFIMFNDVRSPRCEQIHFCKLFPFISDLEKIIQMYNLQSQDKNTNGIPWVESPSTDLLEL